MKFYDATKRFGAVAVGRRATVAVTTAVATFALMFVVVMADTSQAQDASKGDSSWEAVDSVLVLPPVYRAKDKSEPSDVCAEDCPDSTDPSTSESPSAVAGTADNPVNASAGTADDPQPDEGAAVDSSAPDGSGSQEQQAAAGGGDPQSADGLDPSIGSTQDYQEQQAAQELGNYGVVQAPAVIVGAPAGLYYLPGTSVPAASGFASAAISTVLAGLDAPANNQGGADAVDCSPRGPGNRGRFPRRVSRGVRRRFSRGFSTHVRIPRRIRTQVGTRNFRILS